MPVNLLWIYCKKPHSSIIPELAVLQYFFSIVIGTVDTFSKMYHFWYRHYFLDDFTRYFGNFFLINLREQTRKIFRYFPPKASSKSIAKPRCCRSVVGNHRAAAPYWISGKVDLPDIQYPVIQQIRYPANSELQITKLKKKL